MWTITRYIARSFIVSFFATLVVLTFVMSIGVIFKISTLLAHGAPWQPVVVIFLTGMPNALALTIPISTLVASLLVFGRMSADGEITAMRACGLSSWQIILSPAVISFLLAILCMYVNNEVVPLAHSAQRTAISELGMTSPLELLEEGRFIRDFEGYTVYVGKKRNDQLKDIRIYETRKEGANREVRAKTGTVRIETNDEAEVDMFLDLYDVVVDPFTENKPWPVYMGEYSVKFSNLAQKRPYTKKEDDLLLDELVASIEDPVKLFPQLKGKDTSVPRMILMVQFNKRFVMAISCFAFVLLGVPLGIRAHRKESSVGIAISLFLVFNFYLFIVIAETLDRHPATRPDLIILIPVLICIELGIYLLKRFN
jgi:lipopolysaccharide export system permease protein